MWEFYLKACEMAFRHYDQMVFQMQIARRQDAVPLVRDYITDWERADRDTRGLLQVIDNAEVAADLFTQSHRGK